VKTFTEENGTIRELSILERAQIMARAQRVEDVEDVDDVDLSA
jgi:hypothetical protein